MTKKVLILATSEHTRGGITSVVKAHREGKQWHEYHCKWIATHIDKSIIYKLWYSISALLTFFACLPFYDLVHIHFSEPPSAMRKFPFLKLAKLFRKKTILHFHAFSPETTLQSKHQTLYTEMFSLADTIIALSGYWQQEIEKLGIDRNKITVLFNPCPAVSETIGEKQNYILFAGTVTKRKGYDILLKAFALIAEKFPDWRIKIAGNGDIDKASELSAQLGIEKQVDLLGWVNGREKEKIFQQAKVFCLPSYAEGFPMAVLDAWAYHLPVVCTPVGGLPEIAENGVNALLFPCGDEAALAQSLTKLLSNESLRNKLSKEAQLLADTTFSQGATNDQLSAIYAKMLT